jgi:hypothetical protein
MAAIYNVQQQDLISLVAQLQRLDLANLLGLTIQI